MRDAISAFVSICKQVDLCVKYATIDVAWLLDSGVWNISYESKAYDFPETVAVTIMDPKAVSTLTKQILEVSNSSSEVNSYRNY